MHDFNALEQELDALKNEDLPIAPEIEEAVQNYRHYAEEVERSLLDQQADERQSEVKEAHIKPR